MYSSLAFWHLTFVGGRFSFSQQSAKKPAEKKSKNKNI